MSDQLAVHGGERTVPEGFVKPWPHITDADREAVMAVLDAPSFAAQQKVQSDGIAQDWADYMGVKHCIPTNSGTAALHMCVAGLGIGPGDEVIVPAFTFWASAAAVLHHNAIPVFVDIDPRTYCIDPDLIEAAITPRTKAIMPVHIHGMPADMDPVLATAEKHGLAVIEDVAQAHGARYKGRLCGSMGDAAGYSAQASKVLSSGCQGGLFTTDSDEVYERASLLQYFGERVTVGREREEQQYNAQGLGWMYRGDMLSQALVRSQIKRLDQNNALRVENCEYLTEHLSELPGLQTPWVPEGREHVFYNYVVGFDPEPLGVNVSPRALREKVQEAMRAEGVPVGQWQTRSVAAQDVFQSREGYGGGCPWRCQDSDVTYNIGDYPCANEFIDSHFYVFDVNPPNGLELMDLYAQAFRKVMGNIDRLLD
jgi:dTDP-4-amino-4,6-dideoxygalactose transaminase